MYRTGFSYLWTIHFGTLWPSTFKLRLIRTVSFLSNYHPLPCMAVYFGSKDRSLSSRTVQCRSKSSAFGRPLTLRTSALTLKFERRIVHQICCQLISGTLLVFLYISNVFWFQINSDHDLEYESLWDNFGRWWNQKQTWVYGQVKILNFWPNGFIDIQRYTQDKSNRFW